MSYDFWLEVPKAKRRQKKKDGLSPEKIDRPQRARQILQSFEPDIEFRTTSKGFVASSADLGNVIVEAYRIRLAFSMSTQPFALYKAIHGLLRRFQSEDYAAVDPQVDRDIQYREPFYEFMLQYRHQFNCTDDEFVIWARGETPQAWIDRVEALKEGRQIAATHMPRGDILEWEQLRDLTDDELWTHLLDVMARNNAAIEKSGLQAYIQICSDRAMAYGLSASRRLDGLNYPIYVDGEDWMQGSLLDYEKSILGQLQYRRYPAAVFDQPQRLTIHFMNDGFSLVFQDGLHALRKQINQLLATGKLGKWGGGRTNTETEEYFYGSDVDAMHSALAPLLKAAVDLGAHTLVKRYGDTGAREEQVPLSVAHSYGQ